MRPKMSEKIKAEVMKQFDAGFLARDAVRTLHSVNEHRQKGPRYESKRNETKLDSITSQEKLN